MACPACRGQCTANVSLSSLMVLELRHPLCCCACCRHLHVSSFVAGCGAAIEKRDVRALGREVMGDGKV